MERVAPRTSAEPPTSAPLSEISFCANEAAVDKSRKPEIAALRKPVVTIMWRVTQAAGEKEKEREKKKERSVAEKAFKRAPPLRTTRNLVNDHGAQRAFQPPPLLLREQM